ncbi:unnamed protein product [marine sediment metagenome]|uniref:Uncharacterized protein n=1 Tax=marine sediment metagenome TaxID=412755 RepID=X1BZ62_9ZZZZ
MGVRNEWNTYTLGRYSEQPDATKLKATVIQAEKDRVVTQAEKDRIVEQSDHTKLKGTTKITDGTNIAKITGEGYQDVKTHSSDHCFAMDYGSAQTAAVLITPASGKKIKVIQVYVSTESITADVALTFGVGVPQFFKLYTAKTQTHTGPVVCSVGGVDKTINLTCGAKTFVSIAYDEVE